MDEVHKLADWDEVAKRVFDTHQVRMVLTGSSSVLVARGQRESLAGRATTIEFPTFSFREVVEAWFPEAAVALAPAIELRRVFDAGVRPEELFGGLREAGDEQRHALSDRLDRYFVRGGYPRLYTGEVPDDRWADYVYETVYETVYERVLGVDIPELFPVDQPDLLRHVYLEVARRTGQELAQNAVAQLCNDAGYGTSQPVVGRYLHFLADALLIREFRRYPTARKRTARVPAKVTLGDLGVRNATFRNAPSLWESPPDIVGPLVETLVQTVLQGPGLQVHFYRERENPKNRRSKLNEIDLVVEDVSGEVVPIEVEFRRQIRAEDLVTLGWFVESFECPFGIAITRDRWHWSEARRVLQVPLVDFLMAF